MEMLKGTEVYHVLKDEGEFEMGIKKAAQILERGGLVAFPTETVYGLGANGLDAKAVHHIFLVKGRPPDNPLILHLHSLELIYQLVEDIPQKAHLLMEKAWPGPLTLVLKKTPLIPNIVTGGLSTVALRIPDSFIALQLLERVGFPLAAPSANRSGSPSPTTANHVLEDLSGKIPLIIDGGETGIGLESTVLDMTKDPPLILRPGGMTLEDLKDLLGDVEVEKGVIGSSPYKVMEVTSPGMKYRHYAPKTPLILVEGREEEVKAYLLRRVLKAKSQGQRVGFMVTKEVAKTLKKGGGLVWIMGGKDDLPTISHHLFALLREMDKANLQLILVQGLKGEGLGLAVMNRLRRSAHYHIIKV